MFCARSVYHNQEIMHYLRNSNDLIFSGIAGLYKTAFLIFATHYLLFLQQFSFYKLIHSKLIFFIYICYNHNLNINLNIFECKALPSTNRIK